ncbi:TPA: hypothetical protein EYO12_03235 [Candidatus Saccharibacteria bacterium]|nr:hypothetical protein [Candidatus Saccharibacteria bacterium]HIO87953.1 hypothetical protein [Candidatus Saccharibacteria bacterium]
MVSVLEGLKQAGATLRAADKIDEFNMILEAQQKIFDLQLENKKLKDEIDKITSKGKLQVDSSGRAWLVATGNLNFGNLRFCIACYDKDQVRSPLIKYGSLKSYCQLCKADFDKG